jgi:hypothetical protein
MSTFASLTSGRACFGELYALSFYMLGLVAEMPADAKARLARLRE